MLPYIILYGIVLLTLCTYLLVILHFAKCMTRLYVSFGFHEKRTNRAVYNTLPGAHDVGRARNGARTTTASVAAPQPVKASRAIKEMPVGR